MSLRERFGFLASVSNYLVVSSFAILALLLLRSGALTIANAALAAGWVVLTNFLFVIAGICLPPLVGTGHTGFPVNVTVPLVFSGLGFLVAYLSWHTGSPLESTVEPIRRFAEGLRWSDAVWFPLIQSAILSIRGMLRREDDPVEQT